MFRDYRGLSGRSSQKFFGGFAFDAVERPFTTV
jgi:hypothetical protein